MTLHFEMVLERVLATLRVWVLCPVAVLSILSFEIAGWC
jgi:hypothetical protein